MTGPDQEGRRCAALDPTGELRELIDDCVHCGFCLPTCPTYVLWGEEMDSPRGRIYLMEIGRQGEAMNDEMVRHFDQCLGCMACVTACPSGVQYGKLIEATRQQVERRYPRRRPRRDRAFRALIFRLFPYPRRLRLLRGRCASTSAPASTGLARRRPPGWRPSWPAARASRPRRRAACAQLGRAALPRGHPGDRAATTAGSGCSPAASSGSSSPRSTRPPPGSWPPTAARSWPRAGQGCCGALSLHAGREAEAPAFARRPSRPSSAAGVDQVVVNAAGCGSAMKEYGHLLARRPGCAPSGRLLGRVRDLSELLVELGPVAPRHPLPMKVA